MIKSKKFNKFIFYFILSAFCLLVVVVTILKKDYKALIKFFSILLGCLFYQAIDIKIIEPLRRRVKKKDKFNAIILIISVIILIINFAMYLLICNKFIDSAFQGLIFPTAYFSARYWNRWMEDDEIDNSEV